MSKFTIDEDAPILIEVTPQPGMREVSLRKLGSEQLQEMAEKSTQAVNGAMNAIHNMAQRVIATMDTLSNKPSQVEVEFGIKLDLESGALIAKAGGEANLKVKMTWKRDEPSK